MINAFAFGALAAAWIVDRQLASSDRSAGGNVSLVESMTANWLRDLNSIGLPYKAALLAAEKAHGIPAYLLARLAWQESRFNPVAKSKAGALGLMQFMPATAKDMGINPLDPIQAINGAARYLVQQYRRFGTWELALKAYNWGPGNVSKWLARGRTGEPRETERYSREILADLSARLLMEQSHEA